MRNIKAKFVFFFFSFSDCLIPYIYFYVEKTNLKNCRENILKKKFIARFSGIYIYIYICYMDIYKGFFLSLRGNPN